MTAKPMSLDPTKISDSGTKTGSNDGFAMLAHVISSRFEKREYSPEINYEPRVSIKWILGTTKGNTVEKQWSTSVPWNDNLVSPDHKHFYGVISKNSDAFYLLQKVVVSGFPADRLGDDISVFDNETFFMVDDTNPRLRGAARKLFPKLYHPEGWDAALAEALARRAAREAQNAAPAYGETQLQSSYTPPAVVQTGQDVIGTAAEALVGILRANGNTVTRAQIPAKLTAYVQTENKKWDDSFRQQVGIALWQMDQLTAVVKQIPNLQLNGETITLR